MKTLSCEFSRPLLASLMLLLLTPATGLGQTTTGQSVVWDAMSKRYDAQKGETNALFTFGVTNISPAEVVVNAVRTSCGCTIAKVPPLPWRLPPGAHGQIEVKVDLRGKFGLLSKIVSVDTSAGLSLLTVNVNIPQPDGRELNRMLAQADRQAVFRNDCANCHAHPSAGKSGEPLFKAVCGICHEAEHRATMVPDLKTLKKPTDRNYWDNWMRYGKPGTLMPAFAKIAGGPLDDLQIESLVTFLTDHFRPARSSDFGDPFAETSGSGL
ncbi:MAG: DUF1573 domain-containing protein [Verrucomicrobia bacterium]|nr:DUF1573 domain-containing protein [Verrucomicrobiota bacterium]